MCVCALAELKQSGSNRAGPIGQLDWRCQSGCWVGNPIRLSGSGPIGLWLSDPTQTQSGSCANRSVHIHICCVNNNSSCVGLARKLDSAGGWKAILVGLEALHCQSSHRRQSRNRAVGQLDCWIASKWPVFRTSRRSSSSSSFFRAFVLYRRGASFLWRHGTQTRRCAAAHCTWLPDAKCPRSHFGPMQG